MYKTNNNPKCSISYKKHTFLVYWWRRLSYFSGSRKRSSASYNQSYKYTFWWNKLRKTNHWKGTSSHFLLMGWLVFNSKLYLVFEFNIHFENLFYILVDGPRTFVPFIRYWEIWIRKLGRHFKSNEYWNAFRKQAIQS